jgi:hypothetical protein
MTRWLLVCVFICGAMVYAAEDKSFCKVLTPQEGNKELRNMIFNFDCQKTTANKDFCSCLRAVSRKVWKWCNVANG